MTMTSVFGGNKLYITCDDLITIYTNMPINFKEFLSLQNEIKHMVGPEICRRIEFRRTNLRSIQDYYLKNGKYPKESCKETIKRQLYHLPPLYQYDYSLPQEKIDSTLEHIIRYNCSLYFPKISMIPKSIRSSLNVTYGRPSIKERVSDASKPKCNRSVRSSVGYPSSEQLMFSNSENPKSK